MSLVTRRRGLIGAGEEIDPSIVWTLKNLDVPEIKTWVAVPASVFAPLGKDVNTTIVLHARFDVFAKQSKLFSIWDNNNSRQAACIGLVTGQTTWMCVANSTKYLPINGAIVSTGEHKVCFTHAANSNSYNYYVKKLSAGETVKRRTLTSNYVDVPYGVNIGAGSSGGQSSFPKGKIILAQIYNRVLSDAEIDSFFA